MSEAAKAREWRLALGLTVQRLADLTGYSREAIVAFEKGLTPKRSWKKADVPSHKKAMAPAPIKEWVWLRYKRACHSVQVVLQSGKEFNW